MCVCVCVWANGLHGFVTGLPELTSQYVWCSLLRDEHVRRSFGYYDYRPTAQF